MSISAVGGVTPQAFQPIAAAAKPEAAEAAGSRDHDGDRDDRTGAISPAGHASAGSVNVIA